MDTKVCWNVFPAARKPESKSIPIFLLSRLPEVTVCSYSTSNDLYDVKSPLVQVTVVQAEILRRFGTKNLSLFGEAPGTIETEALPDTDVEWFPGRCNILLSLFAVLPKSGSKGKAENFVQANATRTLRKEKLITCFH